MELIPQMLIILTQRMMSELYLLTEKSIDMTKTKLRQGLSRDGEELEIKDHVHDLTELIVGQMLTVAHTLFLIGKIVEDLIKETGAAIDIHSFYKNCLSAIHGEFKNYMASLLHGPKIGRSSKATNSIHAISDSLKGKPSSKSKVLSDSAPLFHFINEATEKSLPAELNSLNVLSRRDEMAARKLAEILVVDPFSSAKMDASHRSISKPSLEYHAIFYQMSKRLDDWLGKLFPDEYYSFDLVL